jgi:hypothetical protein
VGQTKLKTVFLNSLKIFHLTAKTNLDFEAILSDMKMLFRPVPNVLHPKELPGGGVQSI